MKNQPYVKKYENGIVVNPITKENPYKQFATKDKRKIRKSNNRKGIGLVVARIGDLSFAKYRVVKQHAPDGRLINNSILV